MSLITRIESQKRNKERFNIYLDGVYTFAVSLEVFTKFGFKKNQELSEQEIEKIITEESYVKAFSKILDFISYQTRTRQEINKKLNDYLYKSISDENLRELIKKRIIERLDDLKLIDDSNFADTYVKQKMELKNPPGQQKIKEFLFKKGIDPTTIEKALEVYSEETQIKGAIFFAEKKLKSLNSQDSKETKQKLWRHLASKGYSSSIVSMAVDTVLKL